MALPLYDYQKDAVRLMLDGAVLNTSKVGTGKTLMAMGCMEALKSQLTLIVAPKSLLYQWRSELNRFMPEVSVLVSTGTPKKRHASYEDFFATGKPKALLISYETLRVDIPIVSTVSFDVAIFDEAHKLKEPNTKLKKAVRFLIAKRRFGLSGSPVVNHYGNTYNILNVLKPREFPNYYQFLAIHTIKTQVRGLIIYRDQDKLTRMFAPHIVYKDLTDAGKTLPPLSDIEIPVELSDKERKIYDKIRHELIFDFEKGDVTKLSPISLQSTLVKLGKLQEVANHLSLVGEHNESSKLEALEELLESQVEEGEKVLIFTRFKRMANLLSSHLGAHLITGDTQNREEVIRDFEQSGKVLVLTNAGREGLNLQFSSVIVHFDQDFTASGMEQRNGRVYRLGQQKPVRIYHLLAIDTIDFKIKSLLARKKALADDLISSIKEVLYG